MLSIHAANENSYGTRELVHNEIAISRTPDQARSFAKQDREGRLVRIGKQDFQAPAPQGMILVYSYNHWTSFADCRKPSDHVEIFWPSIDPFFKTMPYENERKADLEKWENNLLDRLGMRRGLTPQEELDLKAIQRELERRDAIYAK